MGALAAKWIGRRRERQEQQERKQRREREYIPAPGRKRFDDINAIDLRRIPLVKPVEYEISEKETLKLRRNLYGINKQGRFRYRTMREGGITLVWRIA